MVLKLFYASVRKSLFGGKLLPAQVTGLDQIVRAWNDAPGDLDLRWLAYALATVYHETARTMQPIREKGSDAYFFRMYDKDSADEARRKVAERLGNVKAGDGVLFHGRGYVQITGRRNYKLFERRLGVDLTSDAEAADRMLEPRYAAKVMLQGMTQGLFTGKALSDYFTEKKSDWVNARRIINGVDRAEDIAGYAEKFHAALLTKA
jgi:putative chitinase